LGITIVALDDAPEGGSGTGLTVDVGGGCGGDPATKKGKTVMVNFNDSDGKSETWVLSDSGAMRLDDYRKLGRDGISVFGESGGADEVTSLKPHDFLEITKLGEGAGGTVVKALHKPTLTLVAVKKVSARPRAKRAHVKRAQEKEVVGNSLGSSLGSSSLGWTSPALLGAPHLTTPTCPLRSCP
jgi:hypothetical protein